MTSEGEGLCGHHGYLPLVTCLPGYKVRGGLQVLQMVGGVSRFSRWGGGAVSRCKDLMFRSILTASIKSLAASRKSLAANTADPLLASR